MEHLLTMSSGFACDDDDENSPGNENRMQSEPGNWFKYTLGLPMARAPGEKAMYCSAGINLLNGVVRNTTQVWLPELFDSAMLQADDARARQAAVFGLGKPGGAANVKRLEQQLALEEARGDYDGESVVDEIIRTLGRIEDAGARAVLARKLERLSATEPEVSDVNVVTQALWRRRHPALLPTVRRSLAQINPKAQGSLPGLLVLLEKRQMSPEDSIGAEAFDAIARALRSRQGQP